MAASIPQHIAIIPDGNRRWARLHGKTTEEGHREGYAIFKRAADAAFARGVKHITFYAFSTENWNRSAAEVGYLMKLLGWVLSHEAKDYHRKGLKVRVFGDPGGLDKRMAAGITSIENLTRDNTHGQVNICINYGGRDDIVAAVKRLIQSGTPAEEVTPQTISASLSSAGIPDPDLVIRTSGEQRLSNFLPWEATYSELYFTKTLWPDFDEKELDVALSEYAQRQRRYGC